MATTGEECFHQKPIHHYFDGGYDLTFDAGIEHYCQRFGEKVIPAQRCGDYCPAFQSLVGKPLSKQSSMANTSAAVAHDARVRDFLKRCLREICKEIEDNITYLEKQRLARERQWREAEAWLNQRNTQPETLGYEMAKAERDLALALDALQRTSQRLALIKTKRSQPQHLEQLWLEQEELKEQVQCARQAEQRARAIVIERERRVAEQEHLFARWDDAVDRVPLLKQLRAEVARLAESWLAGSPQFLSDADVERIVRFLQSIPTYSTDDVPISILREYVDALSHTTTMG